MKKIVVAIVAVAFVAAIPMFAQGSEPAAAKTQAVPAPAKKKTAKKKAAKPADKEAATDAPGYGSAAKPAEPTKPAAPSTGGYGE